MAWRRKLRGLHRDVGYFISALTLSYCLSGLAVNHVADWNPNYAIGHSEGQVGPLSGGLDDMERQVAEALHLDPDEIRGRILEGPQRFKVFLAEGGEVSVEVGSGRARIKRVTPRAGLFQVNLLHLNRLKGAWTWVADIFAILLALVAASGLLMLRGPLGLGGRGKWWVAAGLAAPLCAIVSYYFTLDP